mgnify:CR=1 FL=1
MSIKAAGLIVLGVVFLGKGIWSIISNEFSWPQLSESLNIFDERPDPIVGRGARMLGALFVVIGLAEIGWGVWIWAGG